MSEADVSGEEAGADGLSIDAGLVRRLLASQFPHWADLPLRRLHPAGSDNVIYRLGQDMSVRLPRGEWAAGQAAKEHAWLPRLAPHLPLPIPDPLGVGDPAFGYPWDWSVSRWLPGDTATVEGLTDPQRTARELAEFLTALQHALPVESATPNPHDDVTGVPMANRDYATRAAIAAVQGTFDVPAMTAVWESALRAPAWDRAPVWFHGDLHLGNLLVSGGQLSAVIDFAGLGAGDPACDLVIAWNLLSPETRPLFRAALQVDDATWTRAQGWALTTGLNAYTCYAAINPLVAMNTRRQISQVLIDHGCPDRRSAPTHHRPASRPAELAPARGGWTAWWSVSPDGRSSRAGVPGPEDPAPASASESASKSGNWRRALAPGRGAPGPGRGHGCHDQRCDPVGPPPAQQLIHD